MASKRTPNALQELYDGLQQTVQEIAREGGAAGTPRVELTRPNDEKFGDFATNVALMLAPVIRDNPRAVAGRIVERAGALPGVASIEIAGPGFVNITLDDDWYRATLRAVLTAGPRWGANVVADPQRVLLEFVSANPTGPIVAANARHAAFGDSLARVLRHAGHDVQTEYYVNDTGNQVSLFGQSILARATGNDVPEEGYRGQYVAELAAELAAKDGDDPEELGARGVAAMIAAAQPQLAAFRVHFDRFQSERALHDAGTVADGLARVQASGQTFEKDGATWLRTTAWGDDKDRALVRSDGRPTYFAADVGYLLDKYERGRELLLYVLGADHHGYIARLQAAAQALGESAESCEIVIMQMVHLLEGGDQKKMSKRRGDFVTMAELLERIGVDAARFFLLQRSHDQTLELDLELATNETDQNPVFYVQYAHARICSIQRKAANELGVPERADAGTVDAAESATLHPSERRLIKRLAELPVLVADAAERRSPHKLTHYALELAGDFSSFYRDCRVVGGDVDTQTSQLRLALCEATRSVLALSLDLIGVSAPEKM